MNFQPHRNILLVLFYVLPLSVFAQLPEKESKDSLKAASDQTVPVAFGRQKKDQVTSSISRVSSDELRKTHTATLSNALIGQLPGVTVLHNGGAPGWDDPSITIRGRHTTLNNGILIYVDRLQVNSLSHIAPEEIESVSVLKDAAGLALFGAKGANGVLLVTTKRGEENSKMNISFNARYGLQTPSILPKVAGSYDYARLYNEALVNDGLQPLYKESELNGYRTGADPYLYPNVNWYDEVLRERSPMQDYSLSFNGGGNNAKYFLMIGFMDNQGLYAHTNEETNSNINFQRINFRSNVDLKITNGLSAEISLGGNIQDRKYPPLATEQLWQNMATYAPNAYSVRTPDGQLTGNVTFPNNPVGWLLEKGYQSRHDRYIQSRFHLNQKLDFLTEGLNVFGAAMFDNEFYSNYNKTRNYAYFAPQIVPGPNGPVISYIQNGLDSDLAVNINDEYENNRTVFQVGFDYDRKFNEHGLSAMVFYQQDKYTIIRNASPFAMLNLAGRVNYNFKEKYFAEASFSYSGTDNYAPGKRFGFFPAVSAGWLIHKEDFWKKNPTINYLKLRASAGVVGNDRGAPRFIYNQYWGPQNGAYYYGTGGNQYSALVQLAMANPDITWEKGRIYNLGIETQLFENKLSVTADVYHENRFDILVNTANLLPAFSGIPTPELANLGRVVNYGTEIEAMFRNKAGEVGYHVGGQFTFARNRVKESYDIPRKEAYSSRDNRSVDQYFGLEAIGFFKNESDIITGPVHTFSNVRPGDLKYKDQNNDGIIDVNDEIAIGSHNYPEVNYSFSTGATYKNFDLEFFFQGFANRSVNLNNYLFRPFANYANISEWAAEGRWTPESHATATFPRLSTGPNANNERASTFWVRDANLLRLRNVQLGYSLPKNMITKLHVKGIRFFVSGLNLLSWDDLDVPVDPETLSTGYPVVKTYTAGINVKF